VVESIKVTLRYGSKSLDIHIPQCLKKWHIENDKKPPKKLQEMIHREYGIDFHALFDIVIDMSQYSNVEILGSDYLKF
jgi:hypothetical protein